MMNPEIMNLVSSFLGSVGSQSRRGLTPWAIRAEEVAASLQMVSGIRAVGAASTANVSLAISGGERLGPGSFATRVGNTAVIPVYGPLVARYSYAYWSYEEICRDLRLAREAGVGSVMLEIDSPGGIGNLIDMVSAEIALTRQTIPVNAHIRGLGASAAYWIASAAEKVTAERTALVGSVGSLIHYVDMEGILTRLGGSVVQAVAAQSPNKRLSRDSDEGKAELQAIVDDAGQMFVDALAAHRGISSEAVLQTYGQGLVFSAPDALSRGMIEAIVPFEQVLAGVAAQPGTSPDADPAAVSSQKKETAMSDLKNTAALGAVLSLATLKADHPGLVAELQAEGSAAERQRIAGIESHAAGLVGVENLVSEMKADGKTTPEQAAGRLLAASKTSLSERLKGFEAMDKAAEGVTSTLSGGAGASTVQTFPQNEEGWNAEWAATAKLQDEYPTAAAYVATMKRKGRAA